MSARSSSTNENAEQVMWPDAMNINEPALYNCSNPPIGTIDNSCRGMEKYHLCHFIQSQLGSHRSQLLITQITTWSHRSQTMDTQTLLWLTHSSDNLAKSKSSSNSTKFNGVSRRVCLRPLSKTDWPHHMTLTSPHLGSSDITLGRQTEKKKILVLHTFWKDNNQSLCWSFWY